jgi:hypothetical protein
MARFNVTDISQPFAMADIGAVTRFPNRSAKEARGVQPANLLGCAVDLAAYRLRAPDQIRLDVAIGPRRTRKPLPSVSSSSLQPDAFAGRLWIETAVGAGLERATLAQYRQHLDLHPYPLIGAVRLSQLSVDLITSLTAPLEPAAAGAVSRLVHGLMTW